ncbi:hypothetical protein [Candidatus Binatus soli]|jgi:hypothetical protein|uniref:hypothetical protein n=1 Tax=Candidatus Binatus soli TaxID=1953413 RepID=UPI003D0F526C
MIKDGKRFCDVCDEEIPAGTKYQRNRMPPRAAGLLKTDPDVTPKWTTNPDGTISMDICIECVLSMNITHGTDEMD